MYHYPESVLNLIKNLARLPGIGEKTAERLAAHMLKMKRSDVDSLAGAIADLKDKIRICPRCMGMSDGALCRICGDPARDASLLCVVEQPADMASIERSGSFKGMYHILNGALSPMNGIGPDDINLKELIERVKSGEVKEVVIATGTNLEGESTAGYIADILKGHPVEVTRIASGVPIGGDLKYVDQVTLRKAMESRHAV
ncbi:MAG: recombination mediator RecR [Deltaproteobacteria bacterium]|jgi:recombination protein RecR|nr:recombination mediator RecR [Deltaproteobacteria bacterium]